MSCSRNICSSLKQRNQFPIRGTRYVLLLHKDNRCHITCDLSLNPPYASMEGRKKFNSNINYAFYLSSTVHAYSFSHLLSIMLELSCPVRIVQVSQKCILGTQFPGQSTLFQHCAAADFKTLSMRSIVIIT